ncbi:MAG: hypothetical protein ACLUFV_01205 [Acutalibacteraceae bacterium]
MEKTQLHLGDEDKTYCDVVRTYTVVGRQISLDVDYAFTEDTYFWLSYTCMFPINKNTVCISISRTTTARPRPSKRLRSARPIIRERCIRTTPRRSARCTAKQTRATASTPRCSPSRIR